MRKYVFKPLFTGLFALLPLAVTIALLLWAINFIENFIGPMIVWLLPEPLEKFYLPGMGLLLILLVAFGAGVLLQTWIARKLWERVEGIFESLPLIKTIYNGVKDMLGFFSGGSEEAAQQVVIVKSPDGVYRLLGFVTRQEFTDLPAPFSCEGEETIAVYLPMSYQLGGYTVMIPRSHVEPVDMSVEDALRFAVTAGVTTEKPDAAEQLEQIEEIATDPHNEADSTGTPS